MTIVKESLVLPPEKTAVIAYRQKTFQLAALLRIKFDFIAETMNRVLRQNQGEAAVDSDDPESWLYYKEVTGEYHESHEPIWVVSVETGDEVKLTKALLQAEPGTRRYYAVGTVGYERLINMYPTQVSLINGILNPIDFETAYQAENGTVIGYPSGLVEANEMSLIPRLSKWIKAFYNRWYVYGFSVTDTYYQHVFLATLYGMLPGKLYALRQGVSKTREAHSFHVKAYLASNGRLDRFYDYLNDHQRMWLYQNVKYLEHFRGNEQQFGRLVDNILTLRGFPISLYKGRQTNTYTETYAPEFMFRRSPLSSLAGIGWDVPVETLYNKQQPLAPDNNPERITVIKETLESASSGNLRTKALDVSYIDYDGSERFPLETVALDQWGYLALIKQRYNIRVIHDNPIQRTQVALSVGDAYIYALFLSAVYLGIPLPTMPAIKIMRGMHDKALPFDSLRSLVSPQIITDGELKQLLAFRNTIPGLNTVEQFNAYTLRTYETLLRFDRYARLRSGFVREAVLSAVFANFFEHSIYTPTERITPEAWLTLRKLDNFKADDPLLPATISALFSQSTGISRAAIDDKGTVHTKMVALMKHLVSYSVHFVGESNEDPIACVDAGYTRFELLKLEKPIHAYLNIRPTTVVQARNNRSQAVGPLPPKTTVVSAEKTSVIKARIPLRLRHQVSLDKTLHLSSSLAKVDIIKAATF